MNLQEISDFLARRDISTHSLTLHGNGIAPADYTYEVNDIAEYKFIDNEKMFSQFCNGATIRINRPELIFNNLYYFTKQLERDFNTLVMTHMFITPPNKAGLGIHHDPNDLFAIQFYGNKKWLIYEPQLDLPLAAKFREYDLGKLYPPTLEVKDNIETEKGSIFFIPRGLPHNALSLDDISIHVSFSFRLTTYYDAFKNMAEKSATDRRFREVANSYNRGWSDDKRLEYFETVFKDFADQSIWTDVDSFRTSCFKQRRKEFKNAFLDLTQLDNLSESSTLITRDIHIRCDLMEEFIALNYYYKHLKFPVQLKKLITTMLKQKQFTVGEICPEYSLDTKLSLFSELIQEGLLTFSNASNGLPHQFYHPYKIVDRTNANHKTILV